jgi:NAD-dependent dihydropyrimidine dehydrogenase PreA subunit
MTYVLTEPCDVKDKTCVDECPVDCIYKGERMFCIRPGECADCGACEPVCPGRGDLLRRRRARPVGPVHRRERQVLRPARLTWRRREDRPAALWHQPCNQLRHQPVTAP